MLLRQILRPLFRRQALPNVRTIVSPAQQAEELAHAEKYAYKWMKGSILVAVPGILIAYVNAFMLEPEDHSPPEFKEYQHVRIRTKAFPWGDGDHSLLHNPQTNAITSGFEEEYVHHH